MVNAPRAADMENKADSADMGGTADVTGAADMGGSSGAATARFAALRFAEDANLSDRAYWYRCPFPVRVGERVLAPVGVHNRLQRAEVGRVLEGAEEDAPYDARLIKCVAARAGARKLSAGGQAFYELGGVRYDEKHYTRFGRVLVGGAAPKGEARGTLAAYGVAAPRNKIQLARYCSSY